MKYLSTADLARYSPRAAELSEQIQKRERYSLNASAKQPNSIFLSHSHHDKELILSTKRFLESQGVIVYVDWLDEGMPNKTSAETAIQIKNKIKSHRKFAVIVTESSKASKWVPWELGFADEAKTLDHVLIVPISQPDRDFSGVEYMRIYYCLEQYQGNWIAWRADPPSIVTLPDWLKK